MRPRESWRWRVSRSRLVCLAAVVVGVGIVSPASFASAACPNQALRTGPSAALPDCRAFELVTPADTGGKIPYATVLSATSIGNFPTELASPLSSSVMYVTGGGSLPGTEGANGFNDLYRAVRGSTGWSSALNAPSGVQSTHPGPGAISADHGYSVWNSSSLGGTLPPDSNFVRLPDGGFELVGAGSIGTDPAAEVKWISAGGGHIVFSSGHAPSAADPNARPGVRLEPAAPETPFHAVYDRTSAGLEVVSLLPGDVTPTEDADYRGTSADGSSVLFQVGTTLYERRNDATTVEVSSGSPTFAGVSSDGGRVFYLKEEKIFRFDASAGSTTEVTPEPGATPVNISADGSHVYFFSPQVLPGVEANEQGEEAEAGAINLYVWAGGGTPQAKFVARLDPGDVSEEVSLAGWIGQNVSPDYFQTNGPGNNPSRTTPDGTVIAFQSRRSLTSYDSEGHVEIYRYDDASGSISCVSCSPAGEPAVSDARFELPSGGGTTAVNALAVIHNLSDDGSRVFFETADSLVPRDVDDATDVYEWRAGAGVALISSGRSPLDSPAGASNYIYGATPSGDDVFIRTVDGLVPAAGTGGTPAIYDARVGGGFAEASQPPCEADACQPAVVPPPLSSPASASVIGRGNVKPRHHKKRRHRGKHKKHRRHPKHGRSGSKGTGR